MICHHKVLLQSLKMYNIENCMDFLGLLEQLGILGPQTSLGASRQLNDEGRKDEAFFSDFLEKGS